MLVPDSADLVKEAEQRERLQGLQEDWRVTAPGMSGVVEPKAEEDVVAAIEWTIGEAVWELGDYLARSPGSTREETDAKLMQIAKHMERQVRKYEAAHDTHSNVVLAVIMGGMHEALIGWLEDHAYEPEEDEDAEADSQTLMFDVMS